MKMRFLLPVCGNCRIMVAEAGKADKREGKPVMNQLLHEDAEKIVSAGIHAVLPDVAVIRALESYDFGTGGVYLVAAGKAAWQMAHAAVSCLSGRIRRGVVITKYGHSGGPLAGIACFEGGHPIPDEGSCRGTRKAL